MTTVDIRALAKLARLDMDDSEVAKLEKEIPAILDFVEAIQGAGVPAGTVSPDVRNVMRDDADAHESGVYSERLLRAAPNKKGERIAVKQVISRKSAQDGSASSGK